MDAGRELTEDERQFIKDVMGSIFDPEDIHYSDYKEDVIKYAHREGLDLTTVDAKKLQWSVETRIKSELRQLQRAAPMQTRRASKTAEDS